jgi:hypothetical protein
VLATHDFDSTDSPVVAPVDTTPTTALPGTEFTGPNGAYTLRVESSWPHRSNVPFQGFEMWELPGATGANMNALVENLPVSLSLQQYVDASKANLPKLLNGATIITSQIVKGAYGQQLGVIEYEASINGNHVRLVALASVKGKHAVVLTMAAGFDQFAQVRAAVDPYLLTLQAS